MSEDMWCCSYDQRGEICPSCARANMRLRKQEHEAEHDQCDTAIKRERALLDTTEELRQCRRELNAIKRERDRLRSVIVAHADVLDQPPRAALRSNRGNE